uniref:ISXO2-like transposase domain-containing protein n=1 Tax=Globodera rostochiensis TaxID=31243 RepID=A0A914I4Z6_GLORO
MDIFAFCEQFSSIEHTIAYMRNRGLLRQIAPICGRNGCRRRMTQVKNATFVYDGYQWRCPTHKGQKISIRAGSFFENAHFELRKGLMLGYCLPIHTQKQILRMSEQMLVEWNGFFRDICSRWLIEQPIRLGGVGHVVQIDEALMARRKHHRGRHVREQWVFGMFDVHAGVGVVQMVEQRDRNTLLPIIEQFVLPGTAIHSDQWGAYMGGAIAAIPVIPPYIHHSVNHRQNFVCPVTGTHTNHVENFWKNLKMKNKAMSGTLRDMLPGYMDEYMWRQFNGKKTLAAFDNIFDQISQFYVVNV